MLQQRDDVGKALVEGQHIGVGRLQEHRPQPVDDGVRHLVGDNVVRQAGEHRLPWQIGPDILGLGAEVTEQDRIQPRLVEGVRAVEGMRKQAQALIAGPALAAARAQAQPAPQRAVKVLQRAHGHGIDHLLVETRIGLGRIEPALQQDCRVVEVHRGVEAARVPVVVDDFQPRPHRAGLQRLVVDINARPVAKGAALLRIGGEDLQRSARGLREPVDGGRSEHGRSPGEAEPGILHRPRPSCHPQE